MDFQIKVKKLGLLEYVDTARFFISQDTFALPRGKRYRHIFMDECEAICLAFNEKTIIHTFGTIQECRLTDYDEEYERCFTKLKFKKNIENNGLVNKTIRPKTYGELWYLVDINQAALFLPKYSPPMLKKPDIVLSKVIRNTATIYKVFSQFYKNPIPVMAQLADFYLNNVNVGHNIIGPPIYWANSDLIPDEGTTNFRTKTFQSLVRVVVDLCSTKGIKPNDLCVLPFIVTNTYLPDMINDEISSYFVTDGYRPMSIARVEEFLLDCDANNFLVPWVLRVKGLEFKVVIIAIEQGDFDFMDPEDRRKIYIMASRCTCLLIIVSSEKDKENIDIYKVIKNYPFGIAL